METEKNYYQNISKFTLLVYFRMEFARNGSEKGRKLHSYKNEIINVDGKEIRNEKWAFDKLHKLITDDFKGKYATAIIYLNEPKKEIARYVYDRVKHYDTPNFITKDADILFTHLESKKLELVKS